MFSLTATEGSAVCWVDCALRDFLFAALPAVAVKRKMPEQYKDGQLAGGRFRSPTRARNNQDASMDVASTAEPRPGLVPGSYKELAIVAWPLILSSAGQGLLHLVDRMFLSWYSTTALAASTPAGVCHWACLSLFLGIGQYVNTFVAQYHGAGRAAQVGRAIWQGCYVALLGGSLILLTNPFADQFFGSFGHSAELVAAEASFFRIYNFGAIFALLAAVLGCYWSGRGITLPLFYVNLSAGLINGVLDYLMIFGHGPFPEMGLEGAAWATVIANVFAATAFTVLILGDRDRAAHRLFTHWQLHLPMLGRLLWYGFPAGLQFMVDMTSFSVLILLIGEVGEAQLAATNLAFNLNGLAFMPFLGIAIAVSTLVGQRIGEGRPELAVATAHKAGLLAVGYAALWGVFYVGLPELLIRPFLSDRSAQEAAEMSATATILLRFVCAYCLFDLLSLTYGSAIRGAGDTRFSLLWLLATSWLLMVLPTYIGYKYLTADQQAWFGGKLYLAWWACMVYVIVAGSGFYLRFLGGRWMSMQVIESAPPLEPEEPSEAQLAEPAVNQAGK